METAARRRVITSAADLAALLEMAVADRPAGLFRPYRYRDPERVDGERMAELLRIDLDECAGCRVRWPCADHRPRDETAAA